MEIDNPNSIHAFNRFEEEGHAEQKIQPVYVNRSNMRRVVCYGGATHAQ